MALKAWLIGAPNWKQKPLEDSAEAFIQLENPTSVKLQQKVRLIEHSVLGVHG